MLFGVANLNDSILVGTGLFGVDEAAVDVTHTGTTCVEKTNNKEMPQGTCNCRLL